MPDGGGWLEGNGGGLVACPGDLGEARRQIVALAVHTGAEIDCRRRFIDLVDSQPDALLRTCRPGHLTGSAVVVASDHHRVLVLWHNKAQRWLQPGGHADGDGNLAHVAWREATEETGIGGLRVHPQPIHADIHEFRPPGEDPHLHFDLRFVIVAPHGAQPRGNHESSGLRWVTMTELGSLGVDDGLMVLAGRGLEVVAQTGV